MPSINKEYDNSGVTISYPARETQLKITTAEYELVACTINNAVSCIKFIRSQYGLGLFESKQIVDTIRSQPTI